MGNSFEAVFNLGGASVIFTISWRELKQRNLGNVEFVAFLLATSGVTVGEQTTREGEGITNSLFSISFSGTQLACSSLCSRPSLCLLGNTPDNHSRPQIYTVAPPFTGKHEI